MIDACAQPTCLFKDMTKEQAEEEVEKIALRGARAALKELGLADENAGTDIRSLREMLTDWRSIKKSILVMLMKWVGFIALGYLTVRFDLLQYLKIGKQ